MAFWNRKRTASRSASGSSSDILYAGETSATYEPASDSFEPAAFDAKFGLPPQVPSAPEAISEPLFVAPDSSIAHTTAPDLRSSGLEPVSTLKPASFTGSTPESAQEKAVAYKPPKKTQSEIIDEAPATPASSAAPSAAVSSASPRPIPKKSFLGLLKSRQKDAPGYLADWQHGIKGRPTAVFIGFLPEVTRKDAAAFALGVAQRHCTNLINSTYGIYKHSIGWTYEVHEGGPRRGYLPAILKKFDGQAGGPITEDSVATIETAQRRVRVERSQTGLTAFLMPESFDGAQSGWLEPGPRLKPIVPVRLWLVWFGAAVFFAGFITLVTTLATRPAPPPLNVPARVALPYESLPISQWPNLLALYARGEVIDALRWKHGKWVIQTVTSTTTPIKTKPAGSPTLPALRK